MPCLPVPGGQASAMNTGKPQVLCCLFCVLFVKLPSDQGVLCKVARYGMGGGALGVTSFDN